MPNKRSPRLLIFHFFPIPPDLIRIPRLLILRKLTFITNYLYLFLSFFVLFMRNFHGKIACFCIYFSFMPYNSLFLFLPPLYNQPTPFLKFLPPRLFSPPQFIEFRNFSDPLSIRTPVYLVLESQSSQSPSRA